MDWLLDLTPDEWNAVRLSIKVASWAMLASLPLGILIAYVLARWRFPGKAVLNGLIHLPLILPPVVTGYLLLLGFGKRGPIGSFLAENFGIVYETDARAEPKVKVLGTFPENSHPAIVYPVAQTAESSDDDTPAFLKCLQTPKAMALFQSQGFTFLAPAM